MQLVEVTTPALAREFIAFPPRLYRNDPNYIRPLDQDVEHVFDPARNKLFRNGELVRWLLLDAHGQTIGRVAAFVNRETAFAPEAELAADSVGAETKVSKADLYRRIGGMGFFDCIDDQAAANMLFDACREWLSARGLEGMDGPINFGDRDKWWGLLTENFGPPIYGAAYNPPYYDQLFRTYGFETFFRQVTYHRMVAGELRPAILARAQRIAADPRYSFRHMRKREWKRYAQDFRTIYNKAWTKHEGVKAMSAEVAEKLFKSMLDILDERIVWFGYYDNEPVSFYINLPEINEILRHFDGKLGWWQKLQFKYHQLRGTVKTLFGVVFGVVPEHQRKGVEAAMVYASAQLIQKPGALQYTETVMNWIGDFNPKMMTVVELIGGKPWREHQTLRYLFDRTRPFERMPILD
ncbi:hypothetical protein F0P96_04495 [Hymenobacter busanensis]|uniref:Uncharacterized protein n=1 Tax=Hymenobacter busanensis TaxID=2607656 RepID=A0A7L4ZTA9_9BACT|nr:hypothetical protein [Hymenobacter busanensis]KAA9339882.1 hypothetical protein F0P96_04495 [Hymenobacter busanensis]QHJ06361.1 hypothetical protein GUY19_03230 [Hymenobacter busanensis]